MLASTTQRPTTQQDEDQRVYTNDNTKTQQDEDQRVYTNNETKIQQDRNQRSLHKRQDKPTNIPVPLQEKDPILREIFFLKLRTPRGGPQEGESCCLGAVGPAPGEKGDNRGEERLRNEALILYYRFYESEIDKRRRGARRAKIE